MFLVDSHCHLDSLDYEKHHQDVAQVLQNAKKMQVGHMLAVAVTLEGSEYLQEWLVDYDEISLSCGVHPLNLESGCSLERLQKAVKHPKVVALGETGLDYYYESADNLIARRLQQESFAAHIAVAREVNKPLIVHTRQAKEETFALLKAEKAEECRGVLHCFTEDIDMARRLLDLGFYISFSGIVTFKNAESLREVAKYVPLDRLLVETDAPYLTPIPFRGKPNEPKNVYYVAEFLATLRQIPIATLAQQTTQNFCELFQVQVTI